MPAAQTIKQAKASFAARGRPWLNAQEQRQLERGAELEQRAERAKEAERRRAAAAKKRVENESRIKHDREMGLLGTQRRKDRFGYMSSQFHLGAFLNKKDQVTVVQAEDDLFGDDGLDDEVMLNALDAPVEHAKSDPAVVMPVNAPPTARRSQSASLIEGLMDEFWDDMESSTQIARELGGSEAKADVEMEMTGKSTSTRSASFGSVDFELTAEDLDHLDPPREEEARPVERRMGNPPPPGGNQIMPPPTGPSKPAGISTTRSKPSTAMEVPPYTNPSSTTMQPPPAKPTLAMPAPSKPTSAMQSPTKPFKNMPPPMKPAVEVAMSSSAISRNTIPAPRRTLTPPASRRLHDPNPQQTKSRTVIKGPFLPASSLYCSPDLGFTLTQLESFVDDDIQLTQAMPG